MKTFVHLQQYLTKFFLEWKLFENDFVGKIKPQSVCSKCFTQKLCRLWDNVKIYNRGRQATDDNILRHKRISCWIHKATSTHSEYVVLIAFTQKNGYANAPQCYVIRTLLVLFKYYLNVIQKDSEYVGGKC